MSVNKISCVERIHEALNPFHTYRYICGLAPFMENYSWRILLKAVIPITVYSCCIIYTTFAPSNHTFIQNNVNSFINDVVYYAFVYMTLIISLSEYYGRNKITKIIRKIAEIDEDFIKYSDIYNVIIDYRIIRKVWYYLFFLQFFIYLPDLLVYLTDSELNSKFVYALPYMCLSFAALTVIFQVVCQFCGLLYMVRARFSWINKKIETYTSDCRMENDENCVLDSKQLRAIQVSCKLHSDLVDICYLINQSYNIQIVLFIGWSFILVVMQGYIVLVFIYDEGLQDYALNRTAMMLIWVVFHLVGLLFVAYSCHKTSYEAAKVGILLHKMTNRRHPLIKNEIEVWSIQAVHDKVVFTACGFFTTDMTFVYGMIGSITTYLVILTQFYKASLSNTDTSNKTSEMVSSTPE